MAELEDPTPSAPAEDSAFHPDNVLVSLLIQVTRCYDLLAILARASSPGVAAAVLQGHERGEVFSSPPFFDPSYEESEDE